MLDPIRYESIVELKDVPITWIPRFEIYYPDLPQFPIVYVHFILDGKRVYGFPVSASSVSQNDKNMNVKIQFLCNKDLDSALKLKEAVRKELEERFGLSDKLGLTDIIKCCNGKKEYENFFRELWKYVSKVYGEYIPYGRFFEETYSIARFVSAWQPKTGRQSEMRMLYNFLSSFGEEISVPRKWNYLEFYLLPTYDEVLNKKLDDFEKFENMYVAIRKVWLKYFVNTILLDQVEMKSMKESWPQTKGDFVDKVTNPMYDSKVINHDEKAAIERLVDAFNRHPGRTAYFIWSIMAMSDLSYRSWSKDFFKKFYLLKPKEKGVGIAQKTVACFLQQGFKNPDAIPIDTWVKAFHENALGISELQDFFSTFSQMGKLERVIWLSSQARKTNIRGFFDVLWCVRFGDTGNNELRGPNPISCYQCKLMEFCVGYAQIRGSNVLLAERTSVDISTPSEKKGTPSKKKGKTIEEGVKNTVLLENAKSGNCAFICLTDNESVPKLVFRPRGKKRSRWKLVDEFSGFNLSNQQVKNVGVVLTVEEMMRNLPKFFASLTGPRILGGGAEDE